MKGERQRNLCFLLINLFARALNEFITKILTILDIISTFIRSQQNAIHSLVYLYIKKNLYRYFYTLVFFRDKRNANEVIIACLFLWLLTVTIQVFYFAIMKYVQYTLCGAQWYAVVKNNIYIYTFFYSTRSFETAHSAIIGRACKRVNRWCVWIMGCPRCWKLRLTIWTQ